MPAMAKKQPLKASVPPPEPATSAPKAKGKAKAETPAPARKTRAPVPAPASKPPAKRSASRAREKVAAAEATEKRWDLVDVMDRIAQGDSATAIAKSYGKTVASLCLWLDSDDSVSKAYARAKEFRAHVLVGEIGDVARDVLKGKTEPNAARVAIDAMKWTASKLLPKQYGDKLELAGKVETDSELSDVQRAARLLAILERARAARQSDSEPRK